ncbi:hypothetical protein R3P38DRAFT_3624561, partial [Favolaschia claudopus]
WLEYLKAHYPTFRNQIEVDFDRLGSLPGDGSIWDQLRTVDSRDLSDEPDIGPPEGRQRDQGVNGRVGNSFDQVRRWEICTPS